MLGGALARTPNEATHLVITGGVTMKLYCCVTTCKYIVTAQWLADSFARTQFMGQSIRLHRLAPRLHTLLSMAEITGKIIY